MHSLALQMLRLWHSAWARGSTCRSPLTNKLQVHRAPFLANPDTGSQHHRLALPRTPLLHPCAYGDAPCRAVLEGLQKALRLASAPCPGSSGRTSQSKSNTTLLARNWTLLVKP